MKSNIIKILSAVLGLFFIQSNIAGGMDIVNKVKRIGTPMPHLKYKCLCDSEEKAWQNRPEAYKKWILNKPNNHWALLKNGKWIRNRVQQDNQDYWTMAEETQIFLNNIRDQKRNANKVPVMPHITYNSHGKSIKEAWHDRPESYYNWVGNNKPNIHWARLSDGHWITQNDLYLQQNLTVEAFQAGLVDRSTVQYNFIQVLNNLSNNDSRLVVLSNLMYYLNSGEAVADPMINQMLVGLDRLRFLGAAKVWPNIFANYPNSLYNVLLSIKPGCKFSFNDVGSEVKEKCLDELRQIMLK